MTNPGNKGKGRGQAWSKGLKISTGGTHHYLKTWRCFAPILASLLFKRL